MNALEQFAVPLRPCTPWCENGDGHPNEHPEDRSCWSTYQTVPLTSRRHRPNKYTDGTWLMPWLNVYLRREHDLDQANVVIHSEETDKELFLTRGEAIELRDTLDALIDMLGRTTG